MKITQKEYSQMTKKLSPKSESFKNTFLAFLVGGIICTIGQVLLELYVKAGMTVKDARQLVSISLVFLGALLTALKIYDNIAKHAGAGSLVPITGFANAIVAPAIEFKSEGYVMGLGAKMFIIVGPVLVYGITASVIYGIVLFVIKLFIPI